MTGQYFHNIDAKGRLFIPAKLREQLGDTLHVTVGQDGCLSVYSDTEWEKFQQKLDERNFTDVKKLRLMFAYMADCEPDAQGRILIPNHLRQRAKLEKEVVVAGIFNRVVIVYFEVTVYPYSQVKKSVTCKTVQHMIKKTNAAAACKDSSAIKIQL